MSYSFTPNKIGPKVRSLRNLDGGIWYRGDNQDLWYRINDNVLRVLGGHITFAPKEHWDNDYFVEELKDGLLDIHLTYKV